jgi:hypothetical protein
MTTASHFTIEPNLSHPDDFYEALIDMHRDLSAEQSQLVNAKLILLLANQIGDLNVLREALRVARDGVANRTPGGVTDPTPDEPKISNKEPS